MSSISSTPSLNASTHESGDTAALGAGRLISSSGPGGGEDASLDDQLKAAQAAADKAKADLDRLADDLQKAKTKQGEDIHQRQNAEMELEEAKVAQTLARSLGEGKSPIMDAIVQALEEKVAALRKEADADGATIATLQPQVEKAAAASNAAAKVVADIKGQIDVNAAAAAAYGTSSKLDVASIMFAALMERDKLLSIQIEAQAATISSENKMMRIANEWMTAVIAKQSQAEQTGDKGKMVDWPPGLEAYLKANGITVANPGQATNAAGFSAIAQAIKMHVDSLSSQSQEDMTRLQQYSNKYNTNNQMCSDFLSSYYQGLNAIMRNIGG